MDSGEIIISENARQIHQALAHIDTEAIGRRVGIIKRSVRKLSVQQLLLALVALSPDQWLTYERVAAVVRLILHGAYSRQALWKRLANAMDRFLISIVAALFNHTSPRPLWNGFRRVWVQDSTSISIPDRYTDQFPGTANQRKSSATLKIQLVMDLVHADIAQLSLSGFTRNDQTASGDILTLVKAGDLVLRDLGYSNLSVFRKLIGRKAFVLSRYYHRMAIFDPETKRQLNLVDLLRQSGQVDQTVLLGVQEQLPMRLVARPVPECVANARRRRARTNRDRRYCPSQAYLTALGWSIFITNIGPDKCNAEQIEAMYRLRWRIEVVFKAWKSHLRVQDLNVATEAMLRVSIAAKLIFCAIVHRAHDLIEYHAPDNNHASFLRVARLLKHFSVVFSAVILAVPLEVYIAFSIRSLAYYERRRDRMNFGQILQMMTLG